MSDGTYSDCTIIIKDSDGIASNTLAVTTFVVDTTTTASIATATAIGAGANHTCAILDNASLKCWGMGIYGQLGYGNTNDLGDGPGEMGDNLPVVDLGTRRTATAIFTDNWHNCALLDNSSVKCWGQNTSGQLGYGNTNHLGDDLGRELGDNHNPVDS